MLFCVVFDLVFVVLSFDRRLIVGLSHCLSIWAMGRMVLRILVGVLVLVRDVRRLLLDL